MATWNTKLSKKELKHLHENGMKTLHDIKETRRQQHILDASREVCWECRSIALKLGVEK